MLDLHEDTQIWRGIYEQDLQAWLTEKVKPGAVCIDIGAAEGVFTVLMAKLAGPSGRVFAFEPSSRGVQIQENLDLNPREQRAPVEIIHAFAGRDDQPADSPGAPPTVGTDRLLASRQVERLDVVKIDVDGGEVDVLNGLIDTLTKYHPQLTIEVHSPELLKGVLAILEPIGYKMRRVEPPAHEHRPIPFNPTLFS